MVYLLLCCFLSFILLLNMWLTPQFLWLADGYTICFFVVGKNCIMSLRVWF